MRRHLRTVLPANSRRNSEQPSRRGAALVLIAALMVCFMIMLTLSVDVAMLHLARTQLRTSTDAAAKAAAVT
ncbi:MAG: pilus assembly protein TadG-related protein, partial [Planctomycetaceae bacterium]